MNIGQIDLRELQFEIKRQLENVYFEKGYSRSGWRHNVERTGGINIWRIRNQIGRGIQSYPIEELIIQRGEGMELKTKRLVLRPWTEWDAESLYEYAKDPAVGPIAGWPPHRSVENSQEIIRDVLSADETYAVCLKQDGKAIGSIGLMIGNASNLNLPETEGEIGFWIGAPFWGQGLIPEATIELLRHSFADLELEKIWCGYFDGNVQSKRVQEKCGFIYHHTNKDIHWELMDDIRTEHITCLTRNEWIAVNAMIQMGTAAGILLD